MGKAVSLPFLTWEFHFQANRQTNFPRSRKETCLNHDLNLTPSHHVEAKASSLSIRIETPPLWQQLALVAWGSLGVIPRVTPEGRCPIGQRHSTAALDVIPREAIRHNGGNFHQEASLRRINTDRIAGPRTEASKGGSWKATHTTK